MEAADGPPENATPHSAGRRVTFEQSAECFFRAVCIGMDQLLSVQNGVLASEGEQSYSLAGIASDVDKMQSSSCGRPRRASGL